MSLINMRKCGLENNDFFGMRHLSRWKKARSPWHEAWPGGRPFPLSSNGGPGRSQASTVSRGFLKSVNNIWASEFFIATVKGGSCWSYGDLVVVVNVNKAWLLAMVVDDCFKVDQGIVHGQGCIPRVFRDGSFVGFPSP